MFENVQKAFIPPFKYEPEGQMIFDSAGTRVLDVRGWGHLYGLAAMALPLDKAEELQDRFGCDVATLLNANWPGAWHKDS